MHSCGDHLVILYTNLKFAALWQIVLPLGCLMFLFDFRYFSHYFDNLFGGHSDFYLAVIFRPGFDRRTRRSGYRGTL